MKKILIIAGTIGIALLILWFTLFDISYKLLESQTVLIGEDFTTSTYPNLLNDHYYFFYSKSIDPATGVGSGLYVFVFNNENNDSEILKVGSYSHLKIGMIRSIQHPDRDKLIVSYVDRTDEKNRMVVVDEYNIPRNESTNIFTFSDEFSQGVLNPIITTGPSENELHVLIPDRTKKALIRWFVIDLESFDVQRLRDIHFGSGVRLYDYEVKDNYIYIPVNTTGKLYLLTLDLQEKRIKSNYIIDEIDHSESTRMSDVDIYCDDLIIVTYLRPAEFSDRSKTGLLGSFVANIVDISEGKSVHLEQLAGHNSSEAVTHYVSATKYDDKHMVCIYTTVCEIHEWHISRVHKNYHHSYLDLYKIKDGSMKLVDRKLMDPSWANSVSVHNQKIFITFNSVDDDNKAWLYIFDKTSVIVRK